MDTRIWTKSEDKWTTFLVLKDWDVYRFKVTGNLLTAKRNATRAIESLQAGEDPSDVGGKSMEKLDTRSITKIEADPDSDSLTIHGGPDGTQKLIYSADKAEAAEILQEVLARTGRIFGSSQEEIGIFEALIPPGLVGIIGGVLVAVIYNAASKLAAGEEVKIGGRRQGMQQLMAWIASTLGPNGTIAVGVLLAILVLGWAAMRIVYRPERTVWTPQGTSAA